MDNIGVGLYIPETSKPSNSENGNEYSNMWDRFWCDWC